MSVFRYKNLSPKGEILSRVSIVNRLSLSREDLPAKPLLNAQERRKKEIFRKALLAGR